MLSLLVDERGFLGGVRRTLAQGNVAPAAVADAVTVLRGFGPVNVPVLANDIDPEGLPLTLVSAQAALGTAVAEADGTVTYTPPADPAVEFDTVVYEIADSEDARDTGQINITISEMQVSIATRPDNTFEVTAGAGPITITVTAPAGFAGSYAADLADLAGGPINLAPPVVSGALEVGAVLSAADGLWIFDASAGTPTQSWQWQRGGVDIPGATGPTYTVQVGDTGIRAVETLTDAGGGRAAASAALGAVLPSADAALLGWWDAADTATLTSSGGAVLAWADKAGGAALAQNVAARQPTTGVRTLNGLNVLDFDGADYLERAIALPASGDVAFHMVLVIDSTSNAFEAVLAIKATNDFQIDAANPVQFDGRVNTAGIGPAVTLTGGPFAGAMILSMVCDFTGAGTIELFFGGVSRGVTAYTTPLDVAAALHVMTNRSRNAGINGAVAELIVSGDTASREGYHAYLAAKWSVV